MTRNQYDYIIGIDPGVNTGYAEWSVDGETLISVQTLPIHKALDFVMKSSDAFRILVRFEDARLRKSFGNSGREVLQGAGSVKRDCKIWEDFCRDSGIDFEAVSPLNKGSKWKDATFKKLTGWTGRTSEHARDAAKLCWRYI